MLEIELSKAPYLAREDSTRTALLLLPPDGAFMNASSSASRSPPDFG
jgi:hypothetical protein